MYTQKSAEWMRGDYEEGTFHLPVFPFRSCTRFRPIGWAMYYGWIRSAWRWCVSTRFVIYGVDVWNLIMSTMTSSFTVRIYYRTFRNRMQNSDLFRLSLLHVHFALVYTVRHVNTPQFVRFVATKLPRSHFFHISVVYFITFLDVT
jgi:hypothetical protein